MCGVNWKNNKTKIRKLDVSICFYSRLFREGAGERAIKGESSITLTLTFAPYNYNEMAKKLKYDMITR